MVSTLKLSGMCAACDDVATNGIKRQHSLARIIGVLSKAETAEKPARPGAATRSPRHACPGQGTGAAAQRGAGRRQRQLALQAPSRGASDSPTLR